MSAAPASRYAPRVTVRRVQEVETLLNGPAGLIASILRQAIEDAQGLRRSKHDPAYVREEARRWLRGRAWEALVANMGAEPRRLRRELERRFEWMKESA